MYLIKNDKCYFIMFKEVLNEGINNGGTSISDYRHLMARQRNAITLKCI